MKKLALVITVVLIVSLFAGCGVTSTCDKCDESFSGYGYWDGFDHDSVLCEDCAMKWFSPMPISSYKRDSAPQ